MRTLEVAELEVVVVFLQVVVKEFTSDRRQLGGAPPLTLQHRPPVI